MGFFKELERKARKRPHFMQEYGEGVDATIEALKEMMVGEPQIFRVYQPLSSEPEGSLFLASDTSDFTMPGSFHLEPPLGRGEQVYVIIVRKERQDDIPSTDVQVCPEAEEEAGQGV